MTVGHSIIIYRPYLPLAEQLQERGRLVRYTQEEKGFCQSTCTVDFQPLQIAGELFRLSVTHRLPLDLVTKKDKENYLFSIRNSKNELMFQNVTPGDIEDKLQKILKSQIVTKK